MEADLSLFGEEAVDLVDMEVLAAPQGVPADERQGECGEAKASLDGALGGFETLPVPVQSDRELPCQPAVAQDCRSRGEADTVAADPERVKIFG